MAKKDSSVWGENTLENDPAEFISSLFLSVKNWRDPYERRWKRFYKLYRSYRDSTAHPFKSNIFVPYIFSIIESVVPKMLGSVFNSRPIISVQPRKGAAVDMSKLLESLLEFQLDEEQLEFFSKILEFFKETAIYGTSFMKIIPRFNDDELVSFNYIDLEPIDLFNIFPDYRAKSVRRMKYIIQLSYMDFDELEKLESQGFYKNVKDVEQYVESAMNVDEAKRARLTDVGILDEYGFDSTRKTIEVLEYWNKDKIYTIGARKIILKEEDNPFGGLLPFIMARYIPVQHELYGIGIPEAAESLQEELNTVRNQRMDNVNLIINRMFIANKYADIDFDSLTSFPGNVILTNDVNAIKPLETRDVTKSAYMEEDIIKRDIDSVTGEYPPGRGEPSEKRETATGIIRLQQASNARFDTVVKMLEFTVIRHVAKMFLWLDYHFLPPEMFIKIVGEEEFQKYNGMMFYGQDIDDILKQYNFQPMGSATTAVKEVRIQQIMQAYKLFNQDPMINQLALRRMVFGVLDIKNENELIIENPPPPTPPPGTGAPQLGGPKMAQGGPNPPNPPMAPQPGAKPLPEAAQMAEMLRVAGGGLIPRGGPSSLPVQSRQSGGEVKAGMPYKVGEAGEEIIIPKKDGVVIPNQGTSVGVDSSLPMPFGRGNYKSAQEWIEAEKQAGYDMAGFIAKYGVQDQSQGQHLTDEFKLPHHITFSDESIYSTPETPGGQWTKDLAGRWYYTPSEYVLTKHTYQELIDYFNKHGEGAVLVLPGQKVKNKEPKSKEQKPKQGTD